MSSGSTPGVLVHGLTPKRPVERSASTRPRKDKPETDDLKRAINAKKHPKLEIDVPSMGPGDPWVAGTNPSEQQQVWSEQQRQHREAERRRSSVVSVAQSAEGSRAGGNNNDRRPSRSTLGGGGERRGGGSLISSLM